jgi:N-glycosidase YbiA
MANKKLQPQPEVEPAITAPAITAFHGDYAFLSNFYPSLVRLEDGAYPTLEHAFQAAKTHDADDRKAIRECDTPFTAKYLGRRVQLRADWEHVKVEIMRDLLRQKFADAELKAMLLATGEAELIEGNTWNDKVWGCVMVKGVWIGKNYLGKLLMDMRRELQS